MDDIGYNDSVQALEDLIESYYPTEVGYPYYVCEGLLSTHKTPIIHMGGHCPICKEFKITEMHNNNELRSITTQLIETQGVNTKNESAIKEHRRQEERLRRGLDELAAFRVKAIEIFPELGV